MEYLHGISLSMNLTFPKQDMLYVPNFAKYQFLFLEPEYLLWITILD
jgi:hypothetical protein